MQIKFTSTKLSCIEKINSKELKMKKIVMLLALLASSALFGENLVVNTDFSQVQVVQSQKAN